MNRFTIIYTEYKHRIYFFVKRYVQKEEDVEYIVQNIFMHVGKNLDKTAKVSLEAIIFEISKQEISSFYKKNQLPFISFLDENNKDSEDE